MDYISIDIASFEEKVTNKGTHTYFKVVISKFYSINDSHEGKQIISYDPSEAASITTLEKNFNDFHRLYSDLKYQNYKSVPELPAKTFFQVKSRDQL